MNFIKFFLVLLFIPLISLTSCGDDDDGGSSQQAEEETTTGGTTGGGDDSCMTANERTNITNFMNKLVGGGDISGSAVSDTNDTSPTTCTGGYAVEGNGTSSWTVSGGFDCPDESFDVQETLAFRNGCLFSDDEQARIISSSSNNLTFTTTEGQTVRRVQARVSSGGTVTINERISTNGVVTSTFRFRENGGGGTTTGDTGTTTGDTGTTTGDTGTTTGDTGTTTGETGTTTGM